MREKADSNVQAVFDAKIGRDWPLVFDKMKHFVEQAKHIRNQVEFPLFKGIKKNTCTRRKTYHDL